MRYSALALQGKTTMLGRYIPAIRMAANDAEKFAAIQATAARGMELAKDETKTFSGQLAQLRNNLGDVAERFGMALMPLFDKFVGILRGFAEQLRRLSDKDMAALIEKVKGLVKVLLGLWLAPKVFALLKGFSAALLAISKGLIAVKMTAASVGATIVNAFRLSLAAAGALFAYWTYKSAEIKAQHAAWIDKHMTEADLAGELRKARETAADESQPFGVRLEAARDAARLSGERLERQQREIAQMEPGAQASGKSWWGRNIRGEDPNQFAKLLTAVQNRDYLQDWAKKDKARLERLEAEAPADMGIGLPAMSKGVRNQFVGLSELWKSLSTTGKEPLQDIGEAQLAVQHRMEHQLDAIARHTANIGGGITFTDATSSQLG